MLRWLFRLYALSIVSQNLPPSFLASHVGMDPAPGFLDPTPLDVECTLPSQIAGQKLHVLYLCLSLSFSGCTNWSVFLLILQIGPFL
jgi:hypothetical protein